MRVRLANTALRNILCLFSICATTLLLLRFTYSPNSKRRHHTYVKAVAERNEKLQEWWNIPAVIPDEYLKNVTNISRHDFEYLINSADGANCEINGGNRQVGDVLDDVGKLKRRRLLILFMVHSKAEHFEYRKTIRQTWGSVGKRLTRIVFLLGNPANETLQKLVKTENDEFGDIVQEDFLETYRNITLKNIMGMKWATEHCGHAKYVVKADDDMFINTRLLISVLIDSRTQRKNLILCKIHSVKNVPRTGKYVIDKSIYSSDYWPPFCFGGCWIVSMDVIRRLYEVSLNTKQIYLDDVYVTGILRTKLSIPLRHISLAYKAFCHTKGNYTLVRTMWNYIDQNRKSEKDSPFYKFLSWIECFS